MAKFPSYEEMGKKVAEKALDEFMYNGKSIREWMQIIASEDAISRQAVMYSLCDACELFHKNGEETCLTKCESYHFLATLPPVISQQKTGRWIDEGWYAEGHSEHAYRCSECGEHYIGYVGEFKYCPNCGTKMSEVEE